MTTHKFPFTAHCRASGLTIPAVTRAGDAATGRVLRQGEEFEVTQDLYDATLDRVGESWLNLTPEEQVQRYGMVRWAEGKTPEEITLGGDDEGYLYKQGLAAREEALKISHPAERAEALAAVEKKYGRALHPVAQGSQHLPAIR